MESGLYLHLGFCAQSSEDCSRGTTSGVEALVRGHEQPGRARGGGNSGDLVSAQGLVSVFRRGGSAHLSEYAGKMLLGFEAAGDGNIQHADFIGAQHLLRSLDAMPEERLVGSLAG